MNMNAVRNLARVLEMLTGIEYLLNLARLRKYNKDKKANDASHTLKGRCPDAPVVQQHTSLYSDSSHSIIRKIHDRY